MATSGTKIVIEINGNINVTGGGDQGPDKKDPDKKKTEFAFSHSAFDYAKNTLLKSVNTVINTNLSLSENYIGQQTLSNINTILSKGESLVKGISLGSVAGWVGIGISVASWATTQYFDFLSKKSSYYQALNAATAQTEFSQTRAGLYNDGRGTLN